MEINLGKSTTTVDTATGPSFTLSNRLARGLWQIIYILLFRLSPIPMHGWRRWLLRSFGAKVGPGAHVYPKAVIWAPWNLEIGAEAGVASGAILYSQDKIVIGRRAVISQGAHLCAGTHDYEVTGFPLRTKPIVIGDYAWVAAEAFILPGVTIGEGAVIGVRSVVTRNAAPWMVGAGNPCRPLKPRLWRPESLRAEETRARERTLGSESPANTAAAP